ncbi:MAG TPA: surface carbohydrate biosynthesis protein [Limnobacter sp.]|nr:surface carbohydrate biosynthesis protein [Limnobacter sp.]
MHESQKNLLGAGKKLVVLPIEIFKREFDGRLLIASHLVDRGYSVLVCPHADPLLQEVYHSFILYKDHAESSLKRFKLWKKHGNTVAGMDDEGLIFVSPEIYIKDRVSKLVEPYCDLAYAWGQEQKQLLQFAFADQKIHVVGNPRFDLTRLYSATKSRSKVSAGFSNLAVLVNTRFVNANGFRTVEEEIATQRQLGLVKNLSHEQAIRDFAKAEQRIIREFIRFCILASRQPGWRITIRPHPAESPRLYQRLAERLSNVVVDNQSSLLQQMKDHDVVVHEGCTTAIEALSMQMPVFGLRPDGLDLDYGHFANQFSENLGSARATVERLRRLEQPCKTAISAQEVQYKINNWQSADCCQKVAESIQAIHHRTASFATNGSSLRRKAMISLVRKRGLVWRMLRLLPWKRLQTYLLNFDYVEQKYPQLESAWLQARYAEISSLHGRGGNAKIHLINEKAFLLEPT